MALLVAVYSANILMMLSVGELASDQMDYLFYVGVGVVMIWWVYLDRRGRRISLPFEFEAFVYFLWPYVLVLVFVQDSAMVPQFVPLLIGFAVETLFFSYEILIAMYDFVSPTKFELVTPETYLEFQLRAPEPARHENGDLLDSHGASISPFSRGSSITLCSCL